MERKQLEKLVYCVVSPTVWVRGHFRSWQGAPTKQYLAYSAEVQRGPGRKGAEQWSEDLRRSTLELAASLLLYLLIFTSCGRSDSLEEQPTETALALGPTRGYILISIDTLRADHLGCYGYHKPTSPFLDSLASKGALFERVFVQYPATLVSHMSLFTGLYPLEHGVYPPSAVLSAEIETLPERFLSAGFKTSGHTEGGFVAGEYGFARGFSDFTDTPYSDDRDIERTFDRGIEFLSRLEPMDRFFLFCWDLLFL